MRVWSKVTVALVAGLGLVGFSLLPREVSGFTQGAENAGVVVPQGHEWITRLAGIELLDNRQLAADDPRNGSGGTAKAQNLSLETPREKAEVARIKSVKTTRSTDGRFDAQYKLVYDAIIGERWVDIGGINAVGAKKTEKYDCIDYITQEPPELQYDHFMRRHDDINGIGGVTAAHESVLRFKKYFVSAAMAPADDNMKVWDGGGRQTLETVDRNYFLFGRAVHLFEDSFSPDHTVRTADDGYRSVRQVKSYLCAFGSEQHAHEIPDSVSGLSAFYKTGDVIWFAKTGTYGVKNMKPHALAATEGTKELWAAFIRTMARPLSERRAIAEREAEAVAKSWLSFNEQEMTQWYKKSAHVSAAPTYVQASDEKESGWGGTTQQQCMQRDWGNATQEQKLLEFAGGRRVCLYNMVLSPNHTGDEDYDNRLLIPYRWSWRDHFQWKQPPDDFRPGDLAHRGIVITLINRSNKATLRREDRNLYVDNAKKNAAPLELTITDDFDTPGQGSPVQVFDGNNRHLYLGFQNDVAQHRYVYLYQPESPRHFRFIRRGDGFYNIRLIDKGRDWSVLHLHDGKPSLAHETSADVPHAQWYVKGLPITEAGGGTYRLLSSSGKVVTLVSGRLTLQDSGSAATDSQRFSFSQLPGARTYQITPVVNNRLTLRSNGDRDKGITASDENAVNRFGFYIEPQSDGRLSIRNLEDDRYWRETNGELKADVDRYGSCPADLGASSGPPQLSLPGFSNCELSMKFSFELSW